MTGFDAYRLFMAIKLHFTTDYDFFMYNGKTNVSEQSFNLRRDKMFHDKLAKHPDPKGLLVSILAIEPKKDIRDIAYSPAAHKRWEIWTRIVQSLTYHIKEELSRANITTFTTPDGEHNPVLKAYLGGKISLETLTVVTRACELTLGIDDPVTTKYNKIIGKYHPFLQYDPLKIQKIVSERLTMRGV